MANKILSSIWILILLVFVSCNTKTKKDAPEFRIYNSDNENLTAQLSTEKSSEEIELKGKHLSEYQKLDPAIYDLQINTKNKSLLQHKIGLAAGEKYTYIFYGDPEISSELNDATFSYKLHSIFEGSENFTKNGFLPSYMVFRDNIKLKKDFSALRVFHAAPGMSPVNVKIKDDNSSKSIAKGLAYGKPVLSEHIESGSKAVEVYWTGAPKPFLIKEFDFKSEKSYIIIFVIKEDKPTIDILEN